MVVTAMGFFIISPSVYAKDLNVKEKAKEFASKAISAAQREINKHAIGFGLGQTFLMGNFEKKGDNKISTDLLYSYTASYSFDLLINFHHSYHEYKQKAVWLRGYTMSIKARSYEYDAFSPYLLGGLGFYMPQIKDYQGVTSEPKYTFGFNAGAGLDLRLNNRIVTGLMAHYHHPFDVKQDTTEDVRGSYFKLLLTAMYMF